MFNREAELKRMKADAAEAIVANRLSLIDKALKEVKVRASVQVSDKESTYLRGRVARQASDVTEAKVTQMVESVMETWKSEKAALSTAMVAHGVDATSVESLTLHQELEKAKGEDVTSAAEKAPKKRHSLKRQQSQVSKSKKRMSAKLNGLDATFTPPTKRPTRPSMRRGRVERTMERSDCFGELVALAVHSVYHATLTSTSPAGFFATSQIQIVQKASHVAAREAVARAVPVQRQAAEAAIAQAVKAERARCDAARQTELQATVERMRSEAEIAREAAVAAAKDVAESTALQRTKAMLEAASLNGLGRP